MRTTTSLILPVVFCLLMFSLAAFGRAEEATETYHCCAAPSLPQKVTNTSELGCALICAGEVWYKSLSTCIIESVCDNVERDYETALSTLKEINNFAFSGFDASPECKKALRRGICAYHFPVCEHDHHVVSHMVCRDTCNAVAKTCNGTVLDDFTALPKCSSSNRGCTNTSSPRAMPSLALLLSCAFVSFALLWSSFGRC